MARRKMYIGRTGTREGDIKRGNQWDCINLSLSTDYGFLSHDLDYLFILVSFQVLNYLLFIRLKRKELSF